MHNSNYILLGLMCVCTASLTYLNIKGSNCTDAGREALTKALQANTNSKLGWLTDDKIDLHVGTKTVKADPGLTGAELSLLLVVLQRNGEQAVHLFQRGPSAHVL